MTHETHSHNNDSEATDFPEVSEAPAENQENPFELVPHEGAQVPRILLQQGNSEYLGEYLAGWKEQSANLGKEFKNSMHTERDQYEALDAERRAAGRKSMDEKSYLHKMFGWRKSGRERAWLLHGVNEEEVEPQGVDTVMKNMRTNTKLIPHDAFPFKSEDSASDRKVDGIPVGYVGDDDIEDIAA